jgi:molybdopterin-guanine dinucleotide biosynthesis protein A
MSTGESTGSGTDRPTRLGAGEPSRLGAVVLTGGTGARLGHVDKASLRLAGVSLLDRALHATRAAQEVVVVGEPVATSVAVTWAREDPPGGGPAAGLMAGLDAFRTAPDLVCVLAVDMPRVSGETVARLVDAATSRPDTDAAQLVDSTGRRQPLAGVYRFPALSAARPVNREHERGLSVRRLVGSLRVVDVPAVGEEAHDVDTWADLHLLEERTGEGSDE